MGRAVLLLAWGRAPGRARGAEESVPSLGECGAGLGEGGWFSGLGRERIVEEELGHCIPWVCYT